ncbi:hypothetical protein [Streptomyces sp. NPDC054756]
MARARFEEHSDRGWPRALRVGEVAAVLDVLHTEPAAHCSPLAALVDLSCLLPGAGRWGRPFRPEQRNSEHAGTAEPQNTGASERRRPLNTGDP